MKTYTFLSIALLACFASSGQVLAQDSDRLVYFTRHAEDQTLLEPLGVSGRASMTCCRPYHVDGGVAECCLEVLDSLGLKRAELLAQWFKQKGLHSTITHVFATHKDRTAQTVRPIAQAAGLAADKNGDGTPDGSDIDLSPGDGVQQLPPLVDDCDAGYELAGSSTEPLLAGIRALPANAKAVVAAHSGNLYPIMQALGIDTTDPKKFPRSATGSVKGFNNLWIVRLDSANHATLVQHLQLDFTFAEKVTP